MKCLCAYAIPQKTDSPIQIQHDARCELGKDIAALRWAASVQLFDTDHEAMAHRARIRNLLVETAYADLIDDLRHEGKI